MSTGKKVSKKHPSLLQLHFMHWTLSSVQVMNLREKIPGVLTCRLKFLAKHWTESLDVAVGSIANRSEVYSDVYEMTKASLWGLIELLEMWLGTCNLKTQFFVAATRIWSKAFLNLLHYFRNVKLLSLWLQEVLKFTLSKQTNTFVCKLQS